MHGWVVGLLAVIWGTDGNYLGKSEIHLGICYWIVEMGTERREEGMELRGHMVCGLVEGEGRQDDDSVCSRCLNNVSSYAHACVHTTTHCLPAPTVGVCESVCVSIWHALLCPGHTTQPYLVVLEITCKIKQPEQLEPNNRQLL